MVNKFCQTLNWLAYKIDKNKSLLGLKAESY